MFVRKKVEKYGKRLKAPPVYFWEYVDQLPEDGLVLMDFFKTEREFSSLGLFQRASGYNVASASEKELALHRDKLTKWLEEKQHPKRRRYRERVLRQIQDEITKRHAGETREMRFTRLIHRASQNLRILEGAGWNMAEIFAKRQAKS